MKKIAVVVMSLVALALIIAIVQAHGPIDVHALGPLHQLLPPYPPLPVQPPLPDTVVFSDTQGLPAWCYVYITDANTQELDLITMSWSDPQEDARYWIDVSYAAKDCEPWRSEGALPLVYDKILESGPHKIGWDAFAVARPSDFPPKAGYEACINWACQTPEDTIFVGQDYALIWGHTFLPVVMLNDNNVLPPRPTVTYAP